MLCSCSHTETPLLSTHSCYHFVQLFKLLCSLEIPWCLTREQYKSWRKLPWSHFCFWGERDNTERTKQEAEGMHWGAGEAWQIQFDKHPIKKLYICHSLNKVFFSTNTAYSATQRCSRQCRIAPRLQMQMSWCNGHVCVKGGSEVHSHCMQTFTG